MTPADRRIRNTLGTNLRRAMAEKGMSQAALAKATGVPLMTINRMIRGENRPLVVTVQKVAKALETSVDSLLTPNGKNNSR